MAKTLDYKIRETDHEITLYYTDENGVNHSRTYSKNGWVQNNGNIVVGVRELAEFRGYKDIISWWHDNIGELNVVIQPNMKYAPVKVLREEAKVTITAYINFTGGADKTFPGAGSKTYAEISTEAIEGKWQGDFDVYGKGVNVTTSVIRGEQIKGDKQSYLEINIKNGSEHQKPIPWSSHVRLNFSNEELFDWSIRDSASPIVIYDYQGDEFIDEGWYRETSAHEFGHALGLGDAYNASYRGGTFPLRPWVTDDGYWAPYQYTTEDDYGNKYDVFVPDNDIMIEINSVNVVTNNDIRMVLEAYKTGKRQLFPWGTKNIDDRPNTTEDIRQKTGIPKNRRLR